MFLDSSLTNSHFSQRERIAGQAVIPSGTFTPEGTYAAAVAHLDGAREPRRHGLAVILDVVYYHLGPDGSYLKTFTPRYFTDRYETDWGEAGGAAQAWEPVPSFP